MTLQPDSPADPTHTPPLSSRQHRAMRRKSLRGNPGERAAELGELQATLLDAIKRSYDALAPGLCPKTRSLLHTHIELEQAHCWTIGALKALRDRALDEKASIRPVRALQGRPVHSPESPDTLQNSLPQVTAGTRPPMRSWATVTGWMRQERGGALSISGVQLIWTEVQMQYVGTRVTVRGPLRGPRSDRPVKIRVIKIEPARQANSGFFEATGSQWRVDRSEGHIGLRIFAGTGNPDHLMVQATSAALAVNQEALHLHVRGSIMNGYATAESCVPVRAARDPITIGWRRRMRNRRQQEQLEHAAPAPSDQP